MMILSSLTMLLATCGPNTVESPDEPLSYPSPPEGEWFYRDLLCEAPYEVPAPRSSGPSWEALVALEGKPIGEAIQAIDGLPTLDASNLAEYRAALAHADTSVRYAACAKLGRDKLEGVAPTLMDALRDEEQTIALLALEGIASQGELWVMPRLIKAIGQHDNNPHLIVRMRAAALLIEWGNYSGVPTLLKVLKENTPIADEADREWEPRSRIAWEKNIALDALEPLAGTRYQGSPDAPVPWQVKSAQQFEAWWQEKRSSFWLKTEPWSDPGLVAVMNRIIGALGHSPLRNADNSRYLLTRLGPPAAPALLGAAKRADSLSIRFHCLEALVEMVDDITPETRAAWTTELLPLTEDPEASIREQTALVLGALKADPSAAVLERLLDADPEIGVRKSAALGLGRLGHAAPLRAALNRDSLPFEIRATCLAALARTGDAQSAQDFLSGLKSSDRGERLATIDLLIQVTGEDFGLDAEGAEEDSGARQRALDALLQNPPTSPEGD